LLFYGKHPGLFPFSQELEEFAVHHPIKIAVADEQPFIRPVSDHWVLDSLPRLTKNRRSPGSDGSDDEITRAGVDETSVWLHKYL